MLKAKACPCGKCGGDFPPDMLDFHHLDPTQKKFTIGNTRGDGNGFSGSNRCPTAVLEAEIAKCIVVCKSCHKEIHRGN